ARRRAPGRGRRAADGEPARPGGREPGDGGRPAGRARRGVAAARAPRRRGLTDGGGAPEPSQARPRGRWSDGGPFPEGAAVQLPGTPLARRGIAGPRPFVPSVAGGAEPGPEASAWTPAEATVHRSPVVLLDGRTLGYSVRVDAAP